MKKFYLFVLVVSGVWWYASRRFNFSDAVAYAQKRPNASWAPRVEYSVGVVYYQRADYQKAEDAFNQLLTDFPDSPYEGRALLRLSESAEENRDFSMAKDAVDRYLEKFPEGPDRPMAEKRREYLLNK
jgi:outer membrane protein assembly factor BamD (BamD/ComL family)